MTGKHLRIEPWGDNAQGVRLHGDKRRPEHATFIVAFPGGDVEISRTSDEDGGAYWVHVRVNRPEDGGDPERAMGRITRARLDLTGNGRPHEAVAGVDDGRLRHLAVRVEREVGRNAALHAALAKVR